VGFEGELFFRGRRAGRKCEEKDGKRRSPLVNLRSVIFSEDYHKKMKKKNTTTGGGLRSGEKEVAKGMGKGCRDHSLLDPSRMALKKNKGAFRGGVGEERKATWGIKNIRKKTSCKTRLHRCQQAHARGDRGGGWAGVSGLGGAIPFGRPF